jgi:hypothetical protein
VPVAGIGELSDAGTQIIACNATQTRTHIPDRATVISIRKYTDARRNTGPRTQVWPSDNSRTVSYMERKSTSKFKFLQAIAILSMTIETP